MRSTSGGFAAALVSLLLLTACTTVPPPRPVVVAPPGVELPITATVLFEIPANQRDFNVSSFGPYVWSYRESPLMKAAALEMMGTMFSDVVLAEGPNRERHRFSDQWIHFDQSGRFDVLRHRDR